MISFVRGFKKKKRYKKKRDQICEYQRHKVRGIGIGKQWSMVQTSCYKISKY